MADFLVTYWMESTELPSGEKLPAQSVVVAAASAQAAVDAAAGFLPAAHPPTWQGDPIITCQPVYTVT